MLDFANLCATLEGAMTTSLLLLVLGYYASIALGTLALVRLG